MQNSCLCYCKVYMACTLQWVYTFHNAPVASMYNSNNFQWMLSSECATEAANILWVNKCRIVVCVTARCIWHAHCSGFIYYIMHLLHLYTIVIIFQWMLTSECAMEAANILWSDKPSIYCLRYSNVYMKCYCRLYIL